MVGYDYDRRLEQEEKRPILTSSVLENETKRRKEVSGARWD